MNISVSWMFRSVFELIARTVLEEKEGRGDEDEFRQGNLDFNYTLHLDREFSCRFYNSRSSMIFGWHITEFTSSGSNAMYADSKVNKYKM